MQSARSKRVPEKIRPSCSEPEPCSSSSALGSSLCAILVNEPMMCSVCFGRRRWCAAASVSTSSAAWPSAALISAHSTCSAGSRPSRSPLTVPNAPSNQISKTSSSTLVALRRRSSRLQCARSCALCSSPSARSIAASCAQLALCQSSSACASSSARSAASVASAARTCSCCASRSASSRSTAPSSLAARAFSRARSEGSCVSAAARRRSSCSAATNVAFCSETSRARPSRSRSTNVAQSAHSGTWHPCSGVVRPSSVSADASCT
mmetsp:Transcript_938/g.2456  ORF Transcript_938/g.2456 Transcript_938/m.2456 type:complete len:265 (+) Transcript_938:439-1233(+)